MGFGNTTKNSAKVGNLKLKEETSRKETLKETSKKIKSLMAEPFYWNLQPTNVTHINELKLYFHILMREQTLKIRLKNHFVVRNPGKKKHI